jgi:DNA-binding transcriptional MerR regulator
MSTTRACSWRIDDLARRAGMTVDTIRYYQRQGMLPQSERAGRVKLYGPPHLERLERFQDLQGRGFSLATIRTLLAGGREHLVDAVFADRGESHGYGVDELLERSAIDPELFAALRKGGLLRDPAEYGRARYDAEDLELLRTMAELEPMELPPRAIVALGPIYADGIETTQAQVLDLFGTGGTTNWAPGELDRLRTNAARHTTELLPLLRRLVDYLHRRTIQRLTLDAIKQGTLPEKRESGRRKRRGTPPIVNERHAAS